MEFKYDSTIEFRDVLFYIAGGGSRAYFFCGGCLIAVSRPRGEGEPCGEIAKFGLTLRGFGGKDRTIANYVRSELSRRGMRWALPADDGEMFVDCVDALNQNTGCSERDLCGHTEISIHDPCLAEHLVSFCVASGLIVTTARDIPQERTIRLFDSPAIVNAYSGFVYEPRTTACVLTQARLIELPSALAALIEGLFDGVPTARRALISERAKDRIDVVVSAPKAADTTTIAAHRQAGRRRVHPCQIQDQSTRPKKAAISEFVQVKYIPRVINIWTYGDGNDGVPRTRPSKSLAGLWAVYCRIDAVLSPEMDGWEGLEPEMDDSRAKLFDAAHAVFGRGAPPFVGANVPRGVTPVQRFALLQYSQARRGLPNCYLLLDHLCKSYASDPNAFQDPQLNGDDLADTVNSIARDALFAGAAAEIAAKTDHRTVGKSAGSISETPSETSLGDADALLDVAEEMLAVSFIEIHRDVRTTRLACVLDKLYRGEDSLSVAAVESAALGNSELLCAAVDVSNTTAFSDSDNADRWAIYASALIDARLKTAGLMSFYA
uniref:UL21 protein n=1 Tax=Anatid alphaherpesvirus 2 TaxID=3080522 RepID=A0AAU0K8G2_9ALPH